MPAPSLTVAQKQLLRFLVVGCSAVATDFVTYTLLLHLLAHAPAKTLAFIAGTIVAYVLNKYWTFEKPGTNHAELSRFVILYTSTLVANVAVNATALLIFPTAILFAFLCATGTSTILNFIGQKWWVFTNN
jgi:putative flippase GtrA